MQLVSPEGCKGQGLVSVVMTMPAQQRGQPASKLQVIKRACIPCRLPGNFASMHHSWPNMVLVAYLHCRLSFIIQRGSHVLVQLSHKCQLITGPYFITAH